MGSTGYSLTRRTGMVTMNTLQIKPNKYGDSYELYHHHKLVANINIRVNEWIITSLGINSWSGLQCIVFHVATDYRQPYQSVLDWFYKEMQQRNLLC